MPDSPGASAAKIGSRRDTASDRAADHQAVAALGAPHAAARAGIDVVDALRRRVPRARRTSSLNQELPPSMIASPGAQQIAERRHGLLGRPRPRAPSPTPRAAARATRRGPSGEPAPVAPSFAIAATAVGTQVRHRRTCGRPASGAATMLAPIRPRPTIPSCMWSILADRTTDADRAARLRLAQWRLDDDLVERLEPGAHVGAQMHAQRATPAIDEHLEVAARLRRLHDAEGVPRARHGRSRGVVAGDLQEDAGVGAALVGLSRRVQEARTEADARGDLPRGRARGGACGSAACFVRRRHRDVGEQREVVAGAQAREVRANPRRGRRRRRPAPASCSVLDAIGEQAHRRIANDRRFCRQAARSPRTSSVSLRVSILLASTSGWSNGLMPITAPATAVAISHRKNSPASAYDVRRRRCARRAAPRRRAPRRRHPARRLAPRSRRT